MKRSLITLLTIIALAISACSDKGDNTIPDTPGQEEPVPDDPSEKEDPEDPEPDPDPTPEPEPTPEPDPTPEPQPEPEIVVLDPGETPVDTVVTPKHPDLKHSVTINQFYDNVYDYLDDYGNIDYVCSQGNGTSWPVITSSYAIRLYQGSSKGGSYIRFRSKNGATLNRVVVSTTTNTKIAYYINGRPSTQSKTIDLASGQTFEYTCTEKCTEICFICMGTSASERWEMDSVTIDYTGGFVEDDFYQKEVEYGPLVQVKFPLKEDFEKDFPTTATPSYYKYGITAGRDNLKWSTWYGSFSWQKPINGGQSAQLRVYQEEKDYEKSQWGHLKTEFFVKDLRKVRFKFYFSEFWNKATISYIEFGSVQKKGSVQIGLTSYSERQTVKDFEYILDNGHPHDAKIVIDLDPATGFPTSGHYDFYFDDFIFE